MIQQNNILYCIFLLIPTLVFLIFNSREYIKRHIIQNNILVGRDIWNIIL